MKFTLPHVVAALSLVIAAPVLAAGTGQENSEQSAQTEAVTEANDSVDKLAVPAAPAAEAPASTPPETETPAAPAAPAAAEEPEEEIICRSIRLDASSRRKTRVCRTQEGWRELNQRR